MLINLSNHPSAQWTENQTNTAKVNYGEIIDYSFPHIEPEASTEQILLLAHLYSNRVIELFDVNNKSSQTNAVHIMGELSFCFAVIAILQKNNIDCIASTTVRDAAVSGNQKTSVFRFVQFRTYPKITS
jgi:hypothetical protein